MNVFVLKKSGFVVLCAAACILCAAAVSPGVRQVFVSGSRNLPVYSVERSDSKIAVTFNCAWGNEDIEKILDTLDKYEGKATFFLVGEWAEKYPESAKLIADSGHEIGGHSYDHKDYSKLSKKEIEADVLRNMEVIEKATGVKIKLIRVPSGSYNNDAITVIEEMGCVPVQWSVDTIDYGGADCESIFSRATEKTMPGDIILMHTGTENTAAALPRILDRLKGNFEFSVVSDMLYKENFYVDNAGKMKRN